MTAPKDPAPPPITRPVVYLGSIVRDQRQIAGLSRPDFAEQVGLDLPAYRRWEEGRWPLKVEQLQKILRHPAMRDVQQLAQAAGIEPAKPAHGDQGSDGSGQGKGGTES